MSDEIESRATKVVNLFKQSLSTQAQENLTSSDYDRLTELVKTMLSEQREETVLQLEEFIRQLRTEVKHRDIDL